MPITGKISSQDEGDSQLVTFILEGRFTDAEAAEWNRRIRELKEMFGTRIKAVTVKGVPPGAKKPRKARRRRGRRR